MSLLAPHAAAAASSFKYHSTSIRERSIPGGDPESAMAEPRSELFGSSPQNNESQPINSQAETNLASAAPLEPKTSKDSIVVSHSAVKFRRRNTRWYLWRLFTICLVAALIAVGVRLGSQTTPKNGVGTNVPSNFTTTVTIEASPAPTSTSTSATLTQTTLQPDNVPPIRDAGLGVAVGVLSNYFATVPNEYQIKLAYDGGNGKLCVRSRSGDSWLNNVQCVEGANPKPGTPITVLDWLGGTTIFFIAVGNLLSGIDHIPKIDSWRMSSLADERIATHELSQLGSVTWLNGTSAWVYYQDPNSQLREHGMDDYRDQIWRDGSVGPLGLALNGTGIGVARWLKAGGEVMEVFVQVANDALHGRTYIDSTWTSDWYDIDGTPGTVSEGTSITAARIDQPGGSMVLLCYISKTKFLTVQWRSTINVTDYSVYSTPKQLIEGDGSVRIGLAAVSLSGTPVVYLVHNQTILELLGSNVAAANWTTIDVTSS